MAMNMPYVATAVTKGRAVRQWFDGWVARASKVTRITRARAGYAAGVASSALGVAVQFGLGWGLILGGLACSWSFLHLYEVDEQ